VKPSPASVSPSAASQATIVATGDLDLESAEDLEREVRQLRGRGVVRVVIDLRGVEFLDSTGLRVLISLRNDAKRQRQELCLVRPAPSVRRVFTLTGTYGLFDWVER
jgi:anti-sigma B factor antagonist